ncbi:MAG: thioesterase [Acidobacteria bacterium]|nr:thioesterase [Acidobacteriota bacterium]
MPHAGSGPSAFRGWRERLLPEIEAISVELPGRESRFHDAPYQSMEALVRDLSRSVLDSLDRGKPFSFFGNSWGSILAFETLHELRRQSGQSAMHLFVSAAGAPQCEPILPPIGHLEDQELIHAVQTRYGGIPAPVLAEKEFLASFLPTLRADIQLLEGYQRREADPLDCPITAFAGGSDATLTRPQVEAWREQTSSTFEVFFLDGGHHYLQDACELLVSHVRQTLLAAIPISGGL